MRWLFLVLMDRHLTNDERSKWWMHAVERDIEAMLRPVADAVDRGEPVPLAMPNVEEIEKAYVDAVRAWRDK